jgi:hypothetical protein
LSHQKAATTNTRTSAPASPATGRNPMEPAGEQGAGPVVGAIAAPRKAWSGGDIAHGSPQPEHSLTEVSAETGTDQNDGTFRNADSRCGLHGTHAGEYRR